MSFIDGYHDGAHVRFITRDYHLPRTQHELICKLHKLFPNEKSTKFTRMKRAQRWAIFHSEMGKRTAR